MDGFGWNAIEEHLQQVRAVHAVNRDALALVRRPPGGNQGDVVPSKLRIQPACAIALDVIGESEATQHAYAIRVQGNAGADLPQLGRLLVDVRLEALALER